MTLRVLTGHVLDRLAELPDESVHCCVSSPPYYGLRDYGIESQVWGGDPRCEHEFSREMRAGMSGGTASAKVQIKRHGASEHGFCHCGAWRGDLGLEPTLDLYLDHMVEIMRAVRRVLRKDGTCWVNIGDSYASGTTAKRTAPKTSVDVGGWLDAEIQGGACVHSPGFKQKDLMLIPWRLAIRLQEDGCADLKACRTIERVRAELFAEYEDKMPERVAAVLDRLDAEYREAKGESWWVRSAIVWSKAAPMPESVTDRPTSAWEPVFLLTKSAKYFWDQEAVREDFADERMGCDGGTAPSQRNRGGRTDGLTKPSGINPSANGGRNMRNHWPLGPAPFPEAHFATFVPEIPRRAILAGTSQKGVCPQCGAPWCRQYASRYVKSPVHGVGSVVGRHYETGSNGWDGAGYPRLNKETTTIGWQPSCSCAAGDAVPATVLDPFLGAGTTALVADRLGRDCIGIELNPAYAAMAENRLRRDAGMFAEIANA
jgi:DNA modification methylase